MRDGSTTRPGNGDRYTATGVRPFTIRLLGTACGPDRPGWALAGLGCRRSRSALRVASSRSRTVDAAAVTTLGDHHSWVAPWRAEAVSGLSWPVLSAVGEKRGVGPVRGQTRQVGCSQTTTASFSDYRGVVGRAGKRPGLAVLASTAARTVRRVGRGADGQHQTNAEAASVPRRRARSTGSRRNPGTRQGRRTPGDAWMGDGCTARLRRHRCAMSREPRSCAESVPSSLFGNRTSTTARRVNTAPRSKRSVGCPTTARQLWSQQEGSELVHDRCEHLCAGVVREVVEPWPEGPEPERKPAATAAETSGRRKVSSVRSSGSSAESALVAVRVSSPAWSDITEPGPHEALH